MSDLQAAKRVVLDYYDALDRQLLAPAAAGDAAAGELAAVIGKFATDDFSWRGVHPFDEQTGADAVADVFWGPLRQSFAPVQRRPDVFLAGRNRSSIEVGHPDATWVCQMGHLLGLFDRPWLGIPSTHKMCMLRYAEFHRVDGGQIAESAIFVDVISVMRQAGVYPLPPQTGSSHIYPGPMTHDGLLFDTQDDAAGEITMDLVESMVNDLEIANQTARDSGSDRMPREILAKTWHEDMIWSGPEGIGATYTIDRYQQQHQYPFRLNIADKTFNGHVARFAEGDYACFFGWPNLTNRATGGFLGLPGSGVQADMRVVDVYRRAGDRLAENWVFIDLPHWLLTQGLDVLARMRQLEGTETL